MEYFNSEVLVNLLKDGYGDIFSRFGMPDGTAYTREINSKAQELYKNHGRFEDGGYLFNQDLKVDVELVDEEIGVIFEDGLEVTFTVKELPEVLVEFSDLGKLIIEYAMAFHLEFEQAVQQVYWLLNKLKNNK